MNFLFTFIFTLSLLNIIKEAFVFTRCIIEAERYNIGSIRVLLLLFSLSFAITSIWNNFSFN